MAKTWVLTGSLENFRATRDRDFRLIGAKERRRGLAEQIEPGDAIGIAGHLYQVLSNGGLMSEMGRCSRTIAEQHDLNDTVESYEVILAEVQRAKVPVPM